MATPEVGPWPAQREHVLWSLGPAPHDVSPSGDCPSCCVPLVVETAHTSHTVSSSPAIEVLSVTCLTFITTLQSRLHMVIFKVTNIWIVKGDKSIQSMSHLPPILVFVFIFH